MKSILIADLKINEVPKHTVKIFYLLYHINIYQLFKVEHV